MNILQKRLQKAANEGVPFDVLMRDLPGSVMGPNPDGALSLSGKRALFILAVIFPHYQKCLKLLDEMTEADLTGDFTRFAYDASALLRELEDTDATTTTPD
jgi:hypothetical protein